MEAGCWTSLTERPQLTCLDEGKDENRDSDFLTVLLGGEGQPGAMTGAEVWK